MNELSLADVVGGSSGDPGRRSRRRSEKRRRRRRLRTVLIFLLVLAVLGGAVGGAWVGLRPMIAQLTAPTDYTGPGEGSVQVRIPEGATGRDIGALLVDGGVVLTVKGFVKAFQANPASGGVQPGTYGLKLKMSSAAAVTALLDDANRLLDRVTLPEGVRKADVPALVAKRTKITEAQVLAAYQQTSAIGLPAEAKGNVEGWLFPATYDVEPDTTAVSLVAQMVARTTAELDSLGVAVGQRQPLLIMASLVQAEGKHPQDFGMIARVLRNRLDRKMPLQLDTTVHYASGNFKVATSVKETKIVSPYNTYLYLGLPVAPIGNPGRMALQAAISPTPGKWLYFVAVNPDTGETKFAETAAEFAVIKKEYDDWAKAHPGR